MAKEGVSKAQWLEVALDTLSHEGIDAVKIGKLAKRLGVARSGFYWHFKDHRELLDSMLEYWIEAYTEVVPQNPRILEGDPKDRLLELVHVVHEYGLNRFDLALRAWAVHDAQTRTIFEQVYARRLEFVGSIFAELGFTGADLAARTQNFVIFVSWKQALYEDASAADEEEIFQRYIAVITTPTDTYPVIS